MCTGADVGSFIESKTSVVQTSNVGFTTLWCIWALMASQAVGVAEGIGRSVAAAARMGTVAVEEGSHRLTV